MERINNLKQNITESQYQLRQIEDSLKTELSGIVEAGKIALEMGVISKEEVMFLEGLTVEIIKTSNIEEFKELYKRMQDINKSIDNHLEELTNSMQELSKLE